MDPCPQCGAAPTSPLACSACGALLDPPADTDPWALFGLEPGPSVDGERLRKELRRVSRLVHPDFHGSDAANRDLAERNSARLNEAYEVLRDDYARADRLVRLLGGPDEQAERQMPQAFLMEVLEWNEAVEEARDAAPGSPPRAALDALSDDLQARREASLAELVVGLEGLPPADNPGLPERLTEARKLLNALRYLDRTLADIRELRLEQAAR